MRSQHVRDIAGRCDSSGLGASFKTRRIVEAQSSLALVKDGKTESLALGEDANFSMRIDPAPSVDAPRG